MDLLANYNDDSLNLEDSPSTFNEKEVGNSYCVVRTLEIPFVTS